MSDRTPAAGAGTSIVTLSVSSSTSGSSTATASPGCLNHLPMVASVTDSPSVGTRISAMTILQPLHRHARPCAGHPRLADKCKKDVDGRDSGPEDGASRLLPGHDSDNT
jgi:hypothetical protein